MTTAFMVDVVRAVLADVDKALPLGCDVLVEMPDRDVGVAHAEDVTEWLSGIVASLARRPIERMWLTIDANPDDLSLDAPALAITIEVDGPAIPPDEWQREWLPRLQGSDANRSWGSTGLSAMGASISMGSGDIGTSVTLVVMRAT